MDDKNNLTNRKTRLHKNGNDERACRYLSGIRTLPDERSPRDREYVFRGRSLKSR